MPGWVTSTLPRGATVTELQTGLGNPLPALYALQFGAFWPKLVSAAAKSSAARKYDRPLAIVRLSRMLPIIQYAERARNQKNDPAPTHEMPWLLRCRLLS